MDLRLDGSRAIVTGASAGIGRAIAWALADEGARLVLVARRDKELTDLADELEAKGYDRPIVVPLDITQPDAHVTVREEARRALGGIDILVNNAGQTDPIGSSLDDEFWLKSMELNFHAKRRLAEATLPDLVKSGRGRIINFIGSFEPLGLSAAFSAVAAARVWSKGLSRVVAKDGITVNCIAPGRVDSEQMSRNYTKERREDFIARNIPARRFGEAHEVACLVAFLASPLASYITGEAFHVDGGLHRHA